MPHDPMETTPQKPPETEAQEQAWAEEQAALVLA